MVSSPHMCTLIVPPNMKAKGNLIETEEASLPEATCLLVAGIFGDTDAKALADRERRTIKFRENYDYREITTCPYCCNCIEFRKFNPSGEAYTAGRYCLMGEITISEYGTCSSAYPRRNGRKRIIYDTTNAPPGFEQGLSPVTMRRFYSKREQFKAAREESRGYRGGTSSYQRADGDKEAVGSGQIPRRLGN